MAFLGKTWFQAKVKASIQHEYKKQFELFSRKLDQKDKVELVAELLAEYLKTPQGETMEREQRIILNKLSFQASLWLPSALAIELAKRLQNRKDAKSPFELVLMARKELINDSSIEVEHVTWWNFEKETKAEPVIAIAK
jgi:hypothetical protein